MNTKELQILQTLFSNAYVGVKDQDWQKSSELCSCKYRHKSLKCAIGHSISDENYVPNIERRSVCCKEVLEAIGLKQINQRSELMTYMRQLQKCHDDSLPGSLKQVFEDFATELKLTIPDDDYQITYFK